MREKFLKSVKRVVVKVGTKLLVDEKGCLNSTSIERIAGELAWLSKLGKEVVLVSSGAIVAGLESLGLKKRPKELPRLQAAAAIGQGQLMHFYHQAFSKHDLRIAQILLTAEDLKERRRHINIKNTFESLLSENVIPIVNENDTVSVDEIKFGDNDQLSALVANLIKSDLLIILTDKDGFLKEGEVVSFVGEIGKDLESHALQAKDWKGIGGMQTKLQAARIVMRSGELMMIANGLKKGVLREIFEYQPVGTLFAPKREKLSGKKRWIAHFVKPQGTLILDDGAVSAICEKEKSLLIPGIREVRGSFSTGDTVNLLNLAGQEIARGVIHCSSDELGKMMNKSKDHLKKIKEIIHRDELVIL